jgi:hypothetical protein
MDVSRRHTLAALSGATATTLVATTPAVFAAGTAASGLPGTRVPGASLRGPSIDLLTPQGNLDGAPLEPGVRRQRARADSGPTPNQTA